MKVRVELDIISCQDCPWFMMGNHTEGAFKDSACMRHEHLKWLDGSFNIPSWCPLKEFEIKEEKK